MTDFVPHIITAWTIEGAAYFIDASGYAHHLGMARAMPKDEADRRAAAWKRREYDNDAARYARDPEEDDRSGVYHITVETTTWERLKAAQADLAAWEREAALEEEEEHDALYDDHDEPRTPEEEAAELAMWAAMIAADQPFKAGDAVTITDQRHPQRGAAGVVVLTETSGYLEIDLGAALVWGWAAGVALKEE